MIYATYRDYLSQRTSETGSYEDYASQKPSEGSLHIK